MPFFPPGGTGGGGANALQNEQFIPVDDQTVFNLASVPTSAVIFTVNGVAYEDTVDFTVVGNVVTWLDTDFQIKAGDAVQVYYLV
jgi:hypothetical protein